MNQRSSKNFVGHTAQRCRRAFTLVELIATMAVVGTLGSVSASILMGGMTGVMESTLSSQLHSELSMALDRVDRELRTIPRDADVVSIAPDIDSLTATSLTWDTDSTLAKVGSELQLTLAGGTAITLLDDVTSLSITAYNDSNSAMAASLSGASCDDIRRIRVQVTISREGVTESLHTKVFLRCAMAEPE